MLSGLFNLTAKVASHQIGRVSDLKVPGVILRPAMKAYSLGLGINMDEVEIPNDGFSSFGDFFVRKLIPGVRPVCADDNCAISPCDGKLIATHSLSDDAKTGLVVKGYDYNLQKLLGAPVGNRFAGGKACVIYLHPRDYHRVHVPMDADLFEVRHIAGTRFPVAPWSEARVSGLYEKNERMVFNFKVGSKYLSLVMVAAFGVGNITSPYGPGEGDHLSSVRTFENNIKCNKGDELGAFRLGSTVVLIWSDGMVKNLIGDPQKVILGQKLAVVSLVNQNAGGAKT